VPNLTDCEDDECLEREVQEHGTEAVLTQVSKFLRAALPCVSMHFTRINAHYYEHLEITLPLLEHAFGRGGGAMETIA
jgi:hypothetical protein